MGGKMFLKTELKFIDFTVEILDNAGPCSYRVEQTIIPDGSIVYNKIDSIKYGKLIPVYPDVKTTLFNSLSIEATNCIRKHLGK